jgi:hypothetical protein
MYWPKIKQRVFFLFRPQKDCQYLPPCRAIFGKQKNPNYKRSSARRSAANRKIPGAREKFGIFL